MKMKKILVVVDVQNDFVNGVLGSPEAQAAMPNVVALINDFDDAADIYITQDTHDEGYMNTLEGHYLPVPHCIENTEGWQIHPDVANLFAEMYTIMKPTFGSETLIGDMIGNYVDGEVEFHFCGFCTDICVISNVLMTRAAFPNSKIFVHASACAGVTPAKHEAALEVMRSCQIEVVD